MVADSWDMESILNEDNSSPRFSALQACPLFQQLDGRGVIEILHSTTSGLFVYLVNLGQARKVHSVFFGGFEHEVYVLMHKAQREIRRVVMFEDERRFVLGHAGADHGSADQLKHFFRRHTQLPAQRQTLPQTSIDDH